MSIGSEMVETAKKSCTVLGDSVPLVKEFFHQRLCSDGGFAGRAGESDLYYTVFGLSGHKALDGRFDPVRFRSFLTSTIPETLPDLVHLAAYIRCLALVDLNEKDLKLHELLSKFRTPDGGFGNFVDSKESNIYSCFLALQAFQDLGRDVPGKKSFIQCVTSLRLKNGGFANSRSSKTASTPATAAAIVIGCCLDIATIDQTIKWLLGQHDGTGFVAGRGVCGPDLLSTAVALHSLALSGTDLTSLREPTLDFIDSLWSSRGGFFGNWFDNVLDCEYTFYGLLALGSLA